MIIANVNSISKPYVSGTLFSSEAQAVIDKLTAPSSSEQNAISVYIDAEVSNGNHALKDYELILSLGATNGLVDLKGSKTAINNGATFDVNGASFTAGEYIDSDYNPAVDGIKFTRDDSLSGIYLKTTDNATANLFGAQTGSLYSVIFVQTADTLWSTNLGTVIVKASTLIGADTVNVISRTASNALQYKQDGVNVDTDGAASIAVPSNKIFIGGKSQDGLFNGASLNGTISSFIAGAAIGFDHSGYNLNLRTLLTSLGTI